MPGVLDVVQLWLGEQRTRAGQDADRLAVQLVHRHQKEKQQ
ncbi:MAG TPA: hypothetical protein VIW24_09950 [Aldersonia sp.]